MHQRITMCQQPQLSAWHGLWGAARAGASGGRDGRFFNAAASKICAFDRRMSELMSTMEEISDRMSKLERRMSELAQQQQPCLPSLDVIETPV